LKFFLNAAPKKISVGYRSQFTIELFAPLTRFREIHGRQDAGSLAAAKTIGGFASVTIV